MANILVIEDDPVQRKNLVKMLEEIEENHTVLEAGCGLEAISVAKNNKIDLFYIDINLPDITGLSFAEKIRKSKEYKLTWIVFITTNIEYMLQAFKGVHCYDYILKPYNKKMVQDMTRNLLNGLYSGKRYSDKDRKSITLDIKGIIAKVYVDEILFIEVFIRTCTVHTLMGNYKVNNLSLKKVMEMLEGTNLVQSHKSYVVNPDYMREIDKSGSSWKIKFDGSDDIAYIGDKYKKQILSYIDKYDIRETEV